MRVMYTSYNVALVSIVSIASDAALSAELAEHGAGSGEVLVWDSVRCDAVTE